MTGPCAAALARFTTEAQATWATLPFFAGGSAREVAAEIDHRIADGTHVLPATEHIFNALRWVTPDAVRVVVLGQDPYPTPGDAHGLAFSVADGVAIPRSLRNIFKELEADLGLPQPGNGSLTPWASQGVLLLNTCLTVEAGRAAAHRGLGWERLTDDVIRHVSRTSAGTVFLLWGADAHKKLPLIDQSRHHVIATAHPSPLSARRGFFGSKPFSRVNDWLKKNGRTPIDWRLIS